MKDLIIELLRAILKALGYKEKAEMDKLEMFIRKWHHKQIDFDGAYGAQCVDLVRQYIKECYDCPQPEPAEGAINWYMDAAVRPVQNQYFNMLQPIEELKRGDIVVFNGTTSNKYGHIAVFVDYNGNDLNCFEQDGYQQNLGAHYCRWSTERLACILRPTGSLS